jgi:uncharacterized ion transporter superfamily protein YfcC
MNKKIKNNDWLIIAIFVLVCSLTWVITNAYHSYVDKRKVVARDDLLTPLDSTIDQEVFEILSKRINLDEEQLTEILSNNQGVDLITPSPTPAEINEETTPTAELTPIEE